MDKTTYFYPNKTLKLGDTLLDLSTPAVMGILNVTPDSFFDGGNFNAIDAALRHTEHLIKEGADIIDVGGMSTKPGALSVSPEEELKRVIPVIQGIKKQFGNIPVSVDTVYGKVAMEAISAGASMINDVSAGSLDDEILNIALTSNVPYVLMHMQGSPATMQKDPVYKNVTKEVFDFLITRSNQLKEKGLREIVIDPGFGFGKTTEHNYTLVNDMEIFQKIGLPVMVGISRKSLICKVLKVDPDKALNGTTALHAILLLKGANILRVHDVKEAREVINIVSHIGISSDNMQ